MPDAKDNAKMTGDTHPPEVESDLPVEEGSPNVPGSAGATRVRGKAAERARQGRPGRGIKKAGILKDKADETGAEGEPDVQAPAAGPGRSPG